MQYCKYIIPKCTLRTSIVRFIFSVGDTNTICSVVKSSDFRREACLHVPHIHHIGALQIVLPHYQN